MTKEEWYKQLFERLEVIADKNIVIIGGHVNWLNKLKKRFRTGCIFLRRVTRLLTERCWMERTGCIFLPIISAM